MTKTIVIILAVIFAVPSGYTIAQSAGTVSIQYGIVESTGTVTKEKKHAGGALVGGLFGALLGPRHRGFKMAAGAITGAAIQGAHTSGTLQQYTVKTVDDGGEIRISTEQQDIRTGDCVMIEQGGHANIRRVSSIHCEPPVTKVPPQHHRQAADECQIAKKELADAKTEKAANLAVTKVRVLCED